MSIFRSAKLEVDVDPQALVVIVYNHRLANKINNALDNYYQGNIKAGEEPIFKIELSDSRMMRNFKAVLPLTALIASKIDSKTAVETNLLEMSK